MRLIGVAVVLLVAGCATAPGASGTPAATTGAPPSASTAPTAPTPSDAPPPSPPGTPSPNPNLLESTTVEATEAPPGAILVGMHGPPPVFRPKILSAPAGDVVFYLDNTSPAGDPHGSHSLAIGTSRDAMLVVSEQVPAGDSAVFTVRGLDAGSYEIWCTYPNHASLGQVGTLTVE